jgi:hypothetical protein
MQPKKQWKHDATKEEVWEAQEKALEVWEATPQVLRNVTKQERRNERRQDH